jgi:hypothetical protein
VAEGSDHTLVPREAILNIPRMSGKSAQLPPDMSVVRNPADHTITIAGMKVAEEEFYQVARAFNDDSAAVQHFIELAQQQRHLQLLFGGTHQRHGSSPFNPKISPRSRTRSGTILWERFTAMDRREQDVIILIAQKIRDAYMPHHRGRDMEPWSQMDRDRQVKWIEMAVMAVRELDKIGLMR